MRVLAVGDVCGSAGCHALGRLLPGLKKEKKIDLTVVNGENSADGNGITPLSTRMLYDAGADIITGGNHSLRRKELYSLLDSSPYLLRPDNIGGEQAGSGYCLYDMGRMCVAVINLSGRVYLDNMNAECPFNAADSLLKRAEDDNAGVILVDFHAEATSEKRALGIYLDGRVSAFFGTHTHVQTADLQILPGGTGYITDLGMTGPVNSVIGVDSDIIIARFRGISYDKFKEASGECMLNGSIFEIDDKTGKAVYTEPVILKTEVTR